MDAEGEAPRNRRIQTAAEQRDERRGFAGRGIGSPIAVDARFSGIALEERRLFAEAVGELRRRCLDILRHGYSSEAERLLGMMDDIYALLVTMDYPDAVTNGLRRQTDIMRGVVEKTRGDLTIAIREQHLEQTMQAFSTRLESLSHEDDPSL